jgi:hypothetical protein
LVMGQDLNLRPLGYECVVLVEALKLGKIFA